MTVEDNMTPVELAGRWSMSAGTLSNWRHQKIGPVYFKAGFKVLYKMKEVTKFERRFTIQPKGVTKTDAPS